MYCVIDFESEAIENRPKYPPEPVGFAIYTPQDPDSKPFYYAWGHPTGNNIDKARAVMELAAYVENPDYALIFHNAPFDCAIIEEKLGIVVPWKRVHDTMLLAFLNNPFGELALKPLCEQLLGRAPEERDEVRDWLVRHGKCRANDKAWGAHIAKAPGDLVGRYAVGDVERTWDLFRYYNTNDKPAESKPTPTRVNVSQIGGSAPW